jgi:hypothetical protein
MHRVLKKDGQLIFIEHAARRIPGWRAYSAGSNQCGSVPEAAAISRAPDALLDASGFQIESLAQGYEPGPRFAAYMYHGVATPR